MSSVPARPDRKWALDTLGLSGSPSARDIAAAYHQRVRETHPDSAGHSSETPDPAQFDAVVEAYRLLTRQPVPPSRSDPPSQPDVVAQSRNRPVRSGVRPPIVAGPVHFTPSRSGKRHG